MHVPILIVLFNAAVCVLVANWYFTIIVVGYFVGATLNALRLSSPARTADVQYVQVQVVPRSAGLATSWRNGKGHVRYLDEETN